MAKFEEHHRSVSRTLEFSFWAIRESSQELVTRRGGRFQRPLDLRLACVWEEGVNKFVVILFNWLLAQEQCKIMQIMRNLICMVIRSAIPTTTGMCEYNIIYIQPMRTTWYGWSLNIVNDHQWQSLSHLKNKHDTDLAQTPHMRLNASITRPTTKRRAPAGCNNNG